MAAEGDPVRVFVGSNLRNYLRRLVAATTKTLKLCREHFLLADAVPIETIRESFALDPRKKDQSASGQ